VRRSGKALYCSTCQAARSSGEISIFLAQLEALNLHLFAIAHTTKPRRLRHIQQSKFVGLENYSSHQFTYYRMADQGPDLPAAPSITEREGIGGAPSVAPNGGASVGGAKKKSRSSREAAAIKRRCVSTACIACRRRKSKCDGNTPSCAACSSVYGTGKEYFQFYLVF
jgi:hypothetical protein